MIVSGKRGPSLRCTTQICVSGYISSPNILPTCAISCKDKEAPCAPGLQLGWWRHCCQQSSENSHPTFKFLNLVHLLDDSCHYRVTWCLNDYTQLTNILPIGNAFQCCTQGQELWLQVSVCPLNFRGSGVKVDHKFWPKFSWWWWEIGLDVADLCGNYASH
jgi:hypothetical protein